jgi:hypothetical protein
MNSTRKSQRRILLSDEEDGNDADRDDDLLDTPANKLAENMNTLSMNSTDTSKLKALSGGNEKQAVNIRNKLHKGQFASSDEEAENDTSQNRSSSKHSPMQIIMIDDSSDHSAHAVDPLVARQIMQGSSSSEAEESYFPPSATTPEGRGKRQSAQIATQKLKSLYYNPIHPTSAEEDNNSAKPSDDSGGGDDEENNSMIALTSKNRRSNASLTSMSSIGSRHGRTPPPESSSTRSQTPGSPLAPRTRQSSRTKSLSSKQDRRRLSAEEEFQRLKSKGLDGVLDENESSENNQDNESSSEDEEEEEDDASDDISQRPVAPSHKKGSSHSKEDGEKALKYYNTVYADQHKSSRKATTGSSSQNIVKKCIKYLEEENRGYREEGDMRGEDGDEYSDINDFIVDDDEVEAEEEATRREKQKKKKKTSKGKKQKQMMTDEDESDEEDAESDEEEEAFAATKSKKRAASSSKTTWKQGSKLASSDDDAEDGMDEEEDYNPRKRSRNRKAQKKHSIDENDDDEEEEEENDEEALDGPLLYYKLNAMREEEEETRWKASRHRRREDDDDSDPEGVPGESDDEMDGTSIFMTGRQVSFNIFPIGIA